MVVSVTGATEEQAERINKRELKRIFRKFTHMRYHLFLVYFGVLKRLGWVEAPGQKEASTIQDYHPPARTEPIIGLKNSLIERI